MKRIKSLILVLVLLLNTMGICFAAEAEKKPAIVHIPWNMKANDVGAVYGGYFGKLEDTTIAIQPLSSVSGELNPASAKYQVKPFNVTASLAQFEVPKDIPNDVWAIWVKNKTGWSEVGYTNNPILYWVNEHEVFAGQKLLLNGRNVLNPTEFSTKGVQVKFTDVADNSEHMGGVYDATDYSVNIIAPETLVTGHQYYISYSNGVMWTDMEDKEREIVTVVDESDNTKYFNDKYDLNISWFSDINTKNVINVKDKGAKGDGASNDTKAVQLAVDEVANAGGGIVYFPNGTYIVDIITIGANTVLQGENRDGTIIKWSGNDSWDTGRTSIKRSAMGDVEKKGRYIECNKLLYTVEENVGVFDLSLLSDIERPEPYQSTDMNVLRMIYGYVEPIAFYGFDEWGDERLAEGEESTVSDGYVIKNVNIKSVDGAAMQVFCQNNFILEDSNIDVTHMGLELRGCEYSRIRNNTLKNQNRPLLCYMHTKIDGVDRYSEYGWLENNRFIGDNYNRKVERGEAPSRDWAEGFDSIEHRGTDFSGDEYLFMNNTFEGEIGENNDNSGEGFQSQHGAHRITAYVKKADEISITSAADITKRGIKKDDNILIVKGLGIGQLRKVVSVDNDKITVDETWDVIPDETSLYLVNGCIQANVNMVGNTFASNNNKGSLHFYRSGYDAAIRDNIVSDGGGIWLAQIMSGDSRFDFQYYMDVTNNKLSGSSNKSHDLQGSVTAIGGGMDGGIGTWSENNTSDTQKGVLGYGIIIRNNEMEGIGTVPQTVKGVNLDIPISESGLERFQNHTGIIASTSRNNEKAEFVVGEIIDSNIVTNCVQGIELSQNSHHTVIRNNKLDGNGTEIYEATKSTNTMYIETAGLTQGTYEKPEVKKVGLVDTDDKKGSLGDLDFNDSIDEDLENEEIFSDISGHWAESTINLIAERGIVDGKEEGKFCPEDKVTRAEFAKMIVQAIGVGETQHTGSYYDVFKSDWYAPFMQSAKKINLIDVNMTQYNKVFPNRNLTREEAASMAVNACVYDGKNTTAKVSLAIFDDAEQIYDWAKDYMEKAYALGVVIGRTSHTLNPKDTLTRAEAVTIIYNLLKVK